ncbi:MAG: DUF348 domain-containing protein [Hydrogenibacillus sp.]|nr:DUF348 domain-containing protein [Hydrogenibacillus sp.]
MPHKRLAVVWALLWTFGWAIAFTAVVQMSVNRVSVDVDGQTFVVKTRERSVATLLKRLDIHIADGDVVFPAPQARLGRGQAVYVRHAKTVRVIVGRSAPIEVKTTATTVGALVEGLGIARRPTDFVSPAPETELQGGETVRIERIEAAVVARAKPIKAQTVKKADLSLPRGVEKTEQNGRDGKALALYRAVYVNGVLHDLSPLTTKVVETAVPRIVRVGRKPPAPDPPKPKTVTVADLTFTAQQVLTGVVLTAYGPGPGHTGKLPGDPGYGMTATGHRAKEGRTIAVDPDVIPLGSWVYIDGYGLFRAEDTGGAVKGKIIDIYFEDDHKADAFGYRRGNTVYVIGPNKPETR